MTQLLERPPEIAAEFARIADELTRRRFPGDGAAPGAADVSWILAACGGEASAPAAGDAARTVSTIQGQVRVPGAPERSCGIALALPDEFASSCPKLEGAQA